MDVHIELDLLTNILNIKYSIFRPKIESQYLFFITKND